MWLATFYLIVITLNETPLLSSAENVTINPGANNGNTCDDARSTALTTAALSAIMNKNGNLADAATALQAYLQATYGGAWAVLYIPPSTAFGARFRHRTDGYCDLIVNYNNVSYKVIAVWYPC